MQNLQVEVWQDLRLYCLLLGQMQSLLHPKKATMISSTYNLPLLSLKQNVFYSFLLYRKNKLDTISCIRK